MSTGKTAILMTAVGLWLSGASIAMASLPEQLEASAEALRGGSEARAWEIISELGIVSPEAYLTTGADLAVWVAEQYRRQRRFADALSICEKVLDAGADKATVEDRSQAILVKGETFASMQNFVAARLEFRSLTEHDSYNQTDAGRKAQFLILDVLRRTGDFETALEIIDRLRDDPDLETRANALYQRAHIAFDQQMFDEAREFIEMAKEVMPGLIENLFLEARLNLIEDRLQDPELEIGVRVLSTYVIPGRPVSLRMHDRNLAVARGQAGIPVEVNTHPGGDREEITLLPSPRDPTLFRATIPTILGPAQPGNKHIDVKGEDTVSYKILESFQREHDLNYTPKTMMVVADGEITASSGDWVTTEERDQEALQRQIQARADDRGELRAFERLRDTRVVRPGNQIYIQVIDYDRSLSDTNDSVFVTANAASGDRVEGVELTETEPHSGVFRGELETETAPPQAHASDTAKGYNVLGPLSSLDSRTWQSVSDGKKGKWYSVDLMAAHPLTDIVLNLAPGSGLQKASLFEGSGDNAKPVASTHPSARQQYGYVDLAEHFKAKDEPTQTASYLYTEVDAGSGGPATLKIGSCDGVVAWLNGERVHNNQGGRIWKPEEDAVEVTLQPGDNSIMLRVSQLTGPWGASLTVLDANGQGLSSLRPPAPVKPGVVTHWHVFNRLTPENIRVAKRVNVDQRVRIRDEVFRWVPINVTPPAHMTYSGDSLRTTLNDSVGRRQLRWVFEEFSGNAITINNLSANNQFEEQVLPVAVDYSLTGTTRILELGPGDAVEISYHDEHCVRDDEIIYASMRSSFHNANIGFFYDLISMDRTGQRVITYDEAYRYVLGETDRLAIQVVDYDADVSRERDRIRILVGNSKGDQLWLEGIETENHSGTFLAILRLGETTGSDMIATGPDVRITAAYADRENTDGIISRTTHVLPAPDSVPDLQLYRSIVTLPPLIQATGADQPVQRPGISHTLHPDETSLQAPLVTSMEADLRFEVNYPTAALREGSRIPASLIIERDNEKPITIEMGLNNPEEGTFAATVPLRIGKPEAYTKLDADPDEAILYVLGGDVIKIKVSCKDQTHHQEGWFKLASDGTLQFTDRNYEGPGETVHVGDHIYLMLRDLDMTQSDALDTVAITLEGSGNPHEMTLVETLPFSGIFTGRIKIRANATDDPGVDAAGESDNTSGSSLPVAEKPQATEPSLEVTLGGTIKATYLDNVRVSSAEPVKVSATLRVHLGDDGQVAGFTKRFADDDIAVRTRLLTAESLFEMAKDYRTTEQKDLAEEAFAEGRMILEEAIIDYPHTKHAPHAEYLLANLAEELEDYQEALARYNRVLSSWPDSEFAPKSQLKKGICLEAIGETDNAMDTYVELTYTFPGSELISDAVIRLGQHFYRVERFSIAGRVFSQFHRQHAEHQLAPRVLFLAGQSFMKGAEHEIEKAGGGARLNASATEYLTLAESHFKTLIDDYDDPALVSEALYWVGDVYLKQNDLRHAYISFRRLTFDYPESRWARFARGRLAENAEQFSGITE